MFRINGARVISVTAFIECPERTVFRESNGTGNRIPGQPIVNGAIESLKRSDFSLSGSGFSAKGIQFIIIVNHGNILQMRSIE
jgi:hypothetical protein